jgi:hypothetical protein
MLAAIVLLFTVAYAGTPAVASTDCRLSGSWRADNGDTLTLSGIDSSRGEGTFEFHSSFMTNFSLIGGYRIAVNQLQMRGKDNGGRFRDLALELMSISGNSFTTKGHNKIDDRPQIWTRTSVGC